jgi:hypothetical protein
MITESMIIQDTYIISLALTEMGWWESAKDYLITSPTAGIWLTVIQETVLMTLAILIFWQIAKHRRCKHQLKENISELNATNKELRQEIDEINQEQIDILEEIIDAEPPNKKIPGFNPQELKALSELAKRLQ